MRFVRWTVFGVVIIAGVIGIAVSLLNHPGDAAMLEDVEGYEVHDKVIRFNKETPRAHVVFYPGGLVDPMAYVAFGEALHQHGMDVMIMRMPFNLAILDRYAFDDVYEHTDAPWIIGGHSLGAASAAYVVENRATVDGYFILGGYPPQSIDLREKDIPILSLVAQNDEVMDWDSFEARKTNLPASTEYVTIEGGNHAQFGYYGPQRGDGEASISPKRQHELSVEAFIERFSSLLD